MTHKKIFTMKTALLSLTVALLLGITACAEDIIDSANITIKQTPASLDAPEIKGKAYQGVNFVYWEPVKNATGYRLYRDSYCLGTIPYDASSLSFYDHASLSDTSIKDKQKYTYTVVATGVQASRGTNTSTSNTTDFVMTDADILGDSMASVTLKAKVPAVFSKVEAAKNVQAAYMDDAHHKKVVGLYFTKPEYINAEVKFAHKATGADVDIFSYLSTHGLNRPDPADDDTWFTTPYLEKASLLYAWTPSYGGSYSYQVITYWPNSFYSSNDDLSGDIEIPSLDKDAPEIEVTDAADGIVVSFTDDYGASYTLYRAEDVEDGAYDFTAIASGSQFKKQECGLKIVYNYKDTTVEFDKKYVYLLTGTVSGKALNFNWKYPAAKFITHNTGFKWMPQFAAINRDGTVDLSWNVEEGITYKVLKCAIDIDPYSGDEVSHTEEYLTVDASKVAAAVNKVFVMSDTITKRETLGGYKYTLIGENAAKSVNKTQDQTIAWYVTAPTFEITSITGRETNGNGIIDTVEVKLKAKKDIDMSKVKFYRAEVGKDNATTSAGDTYEFITGYTEITLTEDATKRTDTDTQGNITYTYLDSSLSEADIATKYYVYAATETTNNLPAAKTSTLCYSDITLPNFVVAVEKYSESSITYNIGWNAQYAATLSSSEAPLTPSAAIITVQTAKSNAPAITGVKEAEWGAPVTLTANDFANDSTYNLDVSVTDSDLNYLYIKVLFTNDKYKVPKKDDMDNPINYYESPALNNINYKGTVVSILNIKSTMDTGNKVFKNDTEDIDACVFTTSGKLNSSAYVVYVTWVSANGAIIGTPQKLSANALYDVPDDATGHNNIANSYFVANKNSFYFITTPEDKTNVTKALVHITNTDGKTLRSGLIGRWWTP